MKAVFLRSLALLASASLAACSTTGGGGGGGSGGAEVTSYHLGPQIARGQIAVEAFDPADANMPEFGAYSAAVSQELTRLGWTVVNTVGQSEQVAMVDVQQGSRAALAGRVGGGAASRAGTGTAVATMLEVRLRRRSDGSVIWEGRAVGDTPGAPAGPQRVAAVQGLATALFRDFPGVSGRTIRAR